MHNRKSAKSAISTLLAVVVIVIIVVAAGAAIFLYTTTVPPSTTTTTAPPVTVTTTAPPVTTTATTTATLTTTAPTVAPTGPSVLKLGFDFSYTGYLGAFAESQDQGARAAINFINSQGGFKMPWGNVTIVPYFTDDAVSTTIALSNYNELIHTDGVSAVLGGSFAGIVGELNTEAAKTNTVYWPTAVSPLSDFNQSVVATGSYASLANTWSIGYAACSYVLNTLHDKSIYFLGRPDAFGTGQKAGCDAAMKAFGGTYAGYDEYPSGTPDFTPYIAKVVATPNVQALVSVSFGAEVTAFTAAVHAANLTSKMAVMDSFVVTTTWQGVPAASAAGIYGLDYFYYNLPSNLPSNIAVPAEQFVKSFSATMGFPPDAYSAALWISVTSLVGVMQGLGTITPTPAQITSYLTAHPSFTSVKGPATWEPDHELNTALGVFVVEGKPAATRTSPYDIFQVLGYINGTVYLPPLSLEGYGS